MMDVRVSTEMTEVSNNVLARSGDGVYDAMMDATGRLLDVIEFDHGGSAYVLWSEICDRWESSNGPVDVAGVVASAREVAAEWLVTDRDSDDDVDAFFRRRLFAEEGV